MTRISTQPTFGGATTQAFIDYGGAVPNARKMDSPAQATQAIGPLGLAGWELVGVTSAPFVRDDRASMLEQLYFKRAVKAGRAVDEPRLDL